MSPNSTQNGRVCHKVYPKLTPSEAEVLYLITKEYMTVKQAAIKRKCSIKTIYKHFSNLKNKGAFNPDTMVEKNGSTLLPYQGVRLHGQEFNIKILYKDERYRSLLEKANTQIDDGNTLRFYRNSIEIYLGHSFYGIDAQKATSKSLQYWTRYLTRLENKLKIILIKPGKFNISEVNAHYAYYNNQLAKECELKADKIRIYAREDNKLCFVIDNSFNLHEAEWLHPKTAKKDAQEAWQPFIEDLRDNSPPTLTELKSLMSDLLQLNQKNINEIIQINKETAAGLNAITGYLKSTIVPTGADNDLKTYIG